MRHIFLPFIHISCISAGQFACLFCYFFLILCLFSSHHTLLKDLNHLSMYYWVILSLLLYLPKKLGAQVLQRDVISSRKPSLKDYNKSFLWHFWSPLAFIIPHPDPHSPAKHILSSFFSTFKKKFI